VTRLQLNMAKNATTLDYEIEAAAIDFRPQHFKHRGFPAATSGGAMIAGISKRPMTVRPIRRRPALGKACMEHLFIGELLRHLWLQGIRDVEVLRAEVDCGGFDLVVECGGILRLFS